MFFPPIGLVLVAMASNMFHRLIMGIIVESFTAIFLSQWSIWKQFLYGLASYRACKEIHVFYLYFFEDFTKESTGLMCTTRGERRLICFRCQKACMKGKMIISCRMMHNLIKRVMSYFTDEQIDGRTHTILCAHLRFVQYCLNF